MHRTTRNSDRQRRLESAGIIRIAALGALVMTSLSSRASGADRSDVAERLARMEAELIQLRREQQPNWLEDSHLEQLRALTREMMDDASTRRSLLGSTGVAGYDGGTFISNDDGSFRLEITFQHQLRYVHTHRDTSGSPTEDGDVGGFELRRTKIFFSGNAFGPDFEYKVTLSYDRDGGMAELSDAWVRWNLDDGFAIQAGQFKHPFLYEELMSSSRQLTVDRSYLNALRTLGRAQGVMAEWECGERWRFAASFNEGIRIDPDGTNGKITNTAFSDSTSEFAFTARAEALAAGNWRQFRDYTSWSDDEFGLLFGAAAHWQKDEVGTTTFENEFLLWTADAHAEFGGASLSGAIVGSYIDSNDPTVPTYNQIGGIVQGGVHVIPDKVEAFARYEWFDFDGATDATTGSNFSALTAGFNWFIHQNHKVKFSTDVIWAFQPVPDSSMGVGLLADTSPEANDQIVFRSQLGLRW